jgi:hypothetical protein
LSLTKSCFTSRFDLLVFTVYVQMFDQLSMIINVYAPGLFTQPNHSKSGAIWLPEITLLSLEIARPFPTLFDVTHATPPPPPPPE